MKKEEIFLFDLTLPDWNVQKELVWFKEFDRIDEETKNYIVRASSGIYLPNSPSDYRKSGQGGLIFSGYISIYQKTKDSILVEAKSNGRIYTTIDFIYGHKDNLLRFLIFADTRNIERDMRINSIIKGYDIQQRKI